MTIHFSSDQLEKNQRTSVMYLNLSESHINCSSYVSFRLKPRTEHIYGLSANVATPGLKSPIQFLPLFYNNNRPTRCIISLDATINVSKRTFPVDICTAYASG